MSRITALIDYDTERSWFHCRCSCCCVHGESYSTSKLFVPALHALTGMGIDWWGNQVYRRRAGSAQLYRKRAQEARNWVDTRPRQQRPTHGVGSTIWGPLLGGVDLVIEHTGCASRVPKGALECVAVGVCTAVNGIVPLTGRRARTWVCITYTLYLLPHAASRMGRTA
jgi:hypothetical protein